MENTSNVIMFPKEKRDTPPQSMEETVDRIVRSRITFSKAFCDNLMELLDSAFASQSIDFENEYYYADVELLKDALFSLHMKASGVGYYIQDVASDLYDEEGEPNLEEFLEDETNDDIS